jgi:hypothetical protein
MKPNRIFRSTETPFPAVDAVLNHGFAAINDDTSLAVPFGERVIAALKPYDDINPHVLYVGLHYVIVDLNRFTLSDRQSLAQAIEALTPKQSDAT